MLPEHVAAINDHNRNKEKVVRKELDEYELQLVEAAIHQSIRSRQTLIVSLYDPYEELKVIGLIERIDQRAKQIRVDGEWFDMRDIMSAELLDSELTDSP
jgi:hypothetical protein